MAKTPKLTRLRVYPVKGLEGMDVDAWQLDTYGLRLDRRWMVVDADGRCLTRREHPALAAVSAEIDGDRVVLNAPHEAAVELPLEPEPGPTEPGIIGRDQVPVRDVSDDANRWLSRWLRTACRIVYLPDSRLRSVDPALGTRTAQLAFQDELPLHLLTVTSLHDLNRRLRGGVPVEALRPNLVIEDAGPAYAEDNWRRVRIGEVEIHLVKPWPHDAIVRPGGDVSGQDPVEELVSYRTHEGRACFGQLAIATTTVGLLRVGNTVEVLERGKAPQFGPPELEPLADERPDNVEIGEPGTGEPGTGEPGTGEPETRAERRRRKAEEKKKVRVVQLPIGRKSGRSAPEDADTEPAPWEADDEAASVDADEPTGDEPAAAGSGAASAADAPVEEPVVEEPAEEESPVEEPAEEEAPAGEPPPVEEAAAAAATEATATEAVIADDGAPAPPATLPDGIEVTTARRPDLQQTQRLLAAAAVTESTDEGKQLAAACLRAPVLVTAWQGDTLVGLLRGWTDEVRDGFIADVAVHPDHHASGAAQELVRQAVALHPAIRWVLRASPGSAYLGSALGWQHAGSGWYLSPR
ncbi:MAG TPA: GNAT family N-acetyltransferase [Longimicrobiales bacterium]|nr:GNAT family N-acetyltransferase [Longimicrobiales bacterium]